jgi:hypothetical protein
MNFSHLFKCEITEIQASLAGPRIVQWVAQLKSGALPKTATISLHLSWLVLFRRRAPRLHNRFQQCGRAIRLYQVDVWDKNNEKYRQLSAPGIAVRRTKLGNYRKRARFA